MLVKAQDFDADADTFGFDDEAAAQAADRARQLQPLLREKADETERLGTPAPECVDALTEAGLWSIAVPKRLGGLGGSSLALLRVSAELAKGDPSVAWVSQIVNGTTWVASLGPDALQDVLFDGEVPRIIGVFNPPGQARPVDGGYIVNGKWNYSSGYRQAKWGMWGVNIVRENGSVSPGNSVYIPISETTLENTWDVTGLQGSGSDTAVATDVFVPHERMVLAERGFNYVEPGKRHYGAASDFLAQLPMVHRSAAGVPLGTAERLLEVVIDIAKAKPLVGTFYSRTADSDVVAKEIGEAAVKIDAARQLMENGARVIDEAAAIRRKLSVHERAQNKAQANYSIQILEEAVSKLMTIAGSSAFNNKNITARLFRDFSMAARHFGNVPMVGLEVYGRTILGREEKNIPEFMY